MTIGSRVLLKEELSAVTPIWWRNGTSPPPALPPQQKTSAAAGTEPKPKEQGPDPDRERAEREAYQRGFTEGKTAGKEQAAAELQPVAERMSRTLAELAVLRPRIRRDAEKDLLKLAIAIARRVLRRELTLDPSSIEGLIRVALEKLQSRDLCRVRVHPDQEAAIKASLDRFSNAHKIELITDGSLQMGDILFETAHGTLDASIESQLREIDLGFADRLEK